MIPVTNRIEVSLSAGPSIFRVQQEVATGVATSEVSPFDQVTITSFSTSDRSKTAVGANGGVDITYVMTRRLGGTFFARYSGAAVNLSPGSNSVPMRAGGFQAGLGLRVRF
jgi:hypothetical protein